MNLSADSLQHPGTMGTGPTLDSGAASPRSSLFRLAVVVPFFLSAALYLSVIFAVFAALPLVYSHLRYGRVGGFVSSVTNLALVFAASGRVNAAVYFVVAVVLAVAIAECVKFKMRAEWNVVASVLAMLATALVLLGSYSHKFNINPIAKLDEFVGAAVEQVAKNVEKYKATSAVSSQDLEKFLVDPEMTKRNILYELPSAVTITLMVVALANLLLLLRLNIQGARDALSLAPDYFKHWKAPEHMIWPTLAAGTCLVLEIPVLSDAALNVFKVLMAVYAIQGLAIAAYLFDVWGVRGFLRPMGYVLAIAILLPLVISLGFFDLWFTFREKLKV